MRKIGEIYFKIFAYLYQIKNLNEVCAHIMFHFLCISARVDKFFQEEIHDSYIWKNDLISPN